MNSAAFTDVFAPTGREPAFDSGLIIAGTGHRPDKIGGQEAQVRAEIRRLLVVYMPSRIITGMALGFDTWLCEEALSHKREVDPNLAITAAIPYIGQETRWPTDDRVQYTFLLGEVDTVYYVRMLSPPSREKAAEWLDERNHWMVDNAQAVLSCYNGDPSGGTSNCLRYAHMRKRPWHIFDPYKLES